MQESEPPPKARSIIKRLPMIRINVTRWPDYYVHLYQWKLAQKHTKFTKSVSHFCQLLNIPSKYCQRLRGFCQSGEFSPNLAPATQQHAIVTKHKARLQPILLNKVLLNWSPTASWINGENDCWLCSQANEPSISSSCRSLDDDEA